MRIHPLTSIPGYAWLAGEPGNLLYRDDKGGDTIIPGHGGRWVTLDECDSVEEAAEVARLWEEQAPPPIGACVLLDHDPSTGTYQYAPGCPVEDWSEVRASLDELEDRGPLKGWDPYTRLYFCTGNYGSGYFYAVAE